MILRLVLGVVYAGMALGQALSWSELPEILGAYRLPGVDSPAFAAMLIAAELGCGLWLVARPRSYARTPVWIFAAVTLFWTGLGVQAIVRGLAVTNCGCFGVYLTQRLSWLVLVQDALLLCYAYLMLRRATRHQTALDAAGRRSDSAPPAGGDRLMHQVDQDGQRLPAAGGEAP